MCCTRKKKYSIFQIVIPTEKVFEMRNGKKRVREKSFLPGYILVEAELTADEPPNQVDTVCACGGNIDIYDMDTWNYCPNCGKKL